MYLRPTNSAVVKSRSTGIGDFNLDGYDDLLFSPVLASDAGSPVDSYIVYGSTDIFGQKILLPERGGFAGGIQIAVLSGLTFGYGISAAGDLNGDGFRDILMSDMTHQLSYGVYGYRPSQSSSVDYIVGGSADDTLLQVASSATRVNISGQAGDDFLQAVRTIENSSKPYELVMHGGPGDDKLGIATVDPRLLQSIDGGHGFDELFISAYYSGGYETLDLTEVGRNIRGIELIDLGSTNGLEFGFLEVRDLSVDTNTLLLRGNDARAKPVDGSVWTAQGQNSHAGVVYDVYQYAPEDGGDSDIQVWIETGQVGWHPLGR